MLNDNNGLVAKLYKETMDAAREDGYRAGEKSVTNSIKDIFADGVKTGDLYESEDKTVSHPKHYQSKSGIECIDCIEAATESMIGICATDTANIIKYAFRWNEKGTPIQDVEKIIWYATHLLKKLKAEKMSDEEALAYTE